MTGAVAAVATRTGRAPWPDPGEVRPGYVPAAATTGRPGRMRPARQRLLAGALGVSAGAVASAGGPLGPLAAGRWSVGSAGPGDGMRSRWVCSVRLRAGTAEARPGHAARPTGRPHRTPVTVRAGTAVVPAAGRAWPSPGRYAVPAATPRPVLGRLARYEDADGDEPLIAEGAVRAGTATSPTTTGSGVRPPRTPAPPGTRPNLAFAGPPDARRPGGHRCP
ncbi:hypothetical protein [Streptomyces hygroscopicus]|uniref:hypothetical protein n=1 Tax=Streptomyces hygroscopicus TaxID=1912 RepID=UPI0004CC2AB5|nr:hypothetical protein [Streptomyces hygroscopicus]